MREPWKTSWEKGGVEHLLIYFYDAAGSPIGMQYRNSTYSIGTVDSYLFVTNLQGDIEYIYDAYGNRVVTYVYDAWGNILSITGTKATTVGAMNPFRYRGYYYDTETGFYYLNSRYYNPEIGRFINADAYIATGQGFIGNNMFAYCLNNPIIYCDCFGNCAHQIIGDCPSCRVRILSDDIDNLILHPTRDDCCEYEKYVDYEIIAGITFNGWDIRVDSPKNDFYQKHIHVKKGKVWFSQNDDGSPHDGSSGRPNRNVRKFLKNKMNWDWDQKENNYSKKFDLDVYGKALITTITAAGTAYLSWQIVKWGIATLIAPFTGGGSLMVAGITP